MNVVLAFTLEGMVYNSFLSAKLMAETPPNKRQDDQERSFGNYLLGFM